MPIHSIEVTILDKLTHSFSRITNWSAAPVEPVVHGSSSNVGSKLDDEFDLPMSKNFSFDVKIEDGFLEHSSLDMEDFLCF